MGIKHSRRQFKIGLKIWSTNSNYLSSAKELYDQGVYDFIELYTVPDSFESYVSQWRDLSIPCTLHAPHFMQGVNFALKEKEEFNKDIYDQVKKWADELDVDTIVFHPGMGGDIKETARQFNQLGDSRIIIENKPLIPPFIPDIRCNGATYEEVSYVLQETGLRFCLDIGHCYCAANALGLDPFEYVMKFLTFNPKYFHISDNEKESAMDAHMHLGKGTLPLKKILGFLPEKSRIVVETEKVSQDNLDDFKPDAHFLQQN